MDWIDIKKIDCSETIYYFKVNGDIRKGFFSDYPKATHFTTLDVIY